MSSRGVANCTRIQRRPFRIRAVAEPADSHEPQPNAPLESATKPSAGSRPRHRIIKAVFASIFIAGLLWRTLREVLRIGTRIRRRPFRVRAVAEPADSHEPQPNAPLESATKPSAGSRPGQRVIKAVLASILIAGSLWWALPPVLDYVNRKPPVDNGPRALVVISIPPNTDVKKVLPRWTLDKGQESQLSIYFEASEGNQNAVRTPVTIVLISKNEALDTLSCSSLGTTDTRNG